MMTDLNRQLALASQGDAKSQLDPGVLHGNLPRRIGTEAVVIDAKSIKWATMNAWRL